MKKLKVLLDFIGLAVALKIVFCRNVIAKLTGNVLFPNPDVSLDVVKTATDNLEALHLESRDGSHTAIAKMRHAEEELNHDLRILAAYVYRVADGDGAKILSTGFTPSKQPNKTTKPELSVNGNHKSGTVKLVAKAINNAGAYIWQMAKGIVPADETGWQTVGHSTVASFELNSLEIAEKYWFRMAAITRTGTTDFTLPVMKVIE